MKWQRGLKGPISSNSLVIFWVKHQHWSISLWISDKNLCTDSLVDFFSSRLIIFHCALLHPRRLPTSHFCIYLRTCDPWTDWLNFFFVLPSSTDGSHRSCLSSAKMENWQQMLWLWRESRLRNASTCFERQRNIQWKIPKSCCTFPCIPVLLNGARVNLLSFN